MSALLAVTSLEVERRWLLLPLALALGFCPFALPSPTDSVPYDAQFVGGVLAVLVGGLAGLMLGATVIAGDLSSGQLSFLFARPLSWWAIWAGKMLAAALLTVLTGLLTVLPSRLFGSGPLGVASLVDAQGVVIFAGLALLVLGVAHVGSIALRARTWWLAGDLTLLALIAWGTARFTPDPERAMIAWSGWGLTSLAWLSMLTWPVALALHAAGAAQVAMGRTGAERSHRVTSLTAWPLLIGLFAIWQLALLRVANPSLDELKQAWVRVPAPDGDVAWVGGWTGSIGGWMRAGADFVVDASTGHHLPVPNDARRLFFSAERDRVLWLEYEGAGRIEKTVLVSTRLDGLDADATRTPLAVLAPSPPRLRELHLGPDGRWLVALGDDTYVLDARNGRLAATLEEEGGGRVEHVLFTASAEALLYRSSSDGSLGIERLTLPSAALESLGRIAPTRSGRAWKVFHFDAQGTRSLLFGQAPVETQLVDARSGELLARTGPVNAASADGVFLEDGRLLLVETDWTESRLRLLDSGGQQVDTLELDGARGVQVVETTPGQALVSLANFPTDFSRVVVVAMDPLRTLRSERGVFWRRAQGPSPRVQRDRAIGSRVLLQTDAIGVVLYDTATGRYSHVAGERLDPETPLNGS